MGASEGFINDVMRGKKSLTTNHLMSFEKISKTSIMTILPKAVPEEHLPEKLKNIATMRKMCRDFQDKKNK